MTSGWRWTPRVGEGAVGAGHLERRHLLGAEHEGGDGVEAVDAHAVGQGDDVLGTDLHHELRVRRVRRHAGGVEEGQDPLLGAAVVADVPVLAGDLERDAVPGASNFEFRLMFCVMAVASTNGFIAEPGCRPTPPDPVA